MENMDRKDKAQVRESETTEDPKRHGKVQNILENLKRNQIDRE